MRTNQQQKATEDKSILPRVADGLFSHHTDFRDEARASETEVSAYSRQVVQIPTNCCSEVDVEKPSEEVLNPVSMRDDVKKQYHKARIGNLIAVCFAANLGGTGVVTGCAPNLILLGILDTLYESTQLNFATWMLFNIPGMLINVFLGWLWLQASFFNLRVEDVVRLFKKQQRETVSEDVRKRWDDEKASQSRARDVIQRRHEALGPIRFEEAITLFLFVVLVASWIFRAPRFVTGWSAWFERDVSEATPCVLIIFLMFIIPRTPSNPFSSTHQPSETSKGLLTWQIIHEKMPWNVIILMGGAIAMADVCKTSGLTAVLGTQFAKINFLSPGWLLLLMTTLTAFLTELASNAATASIILPILNSMARELNIHPLYLMLPATITTSFSFMLPVANPPNAITYTAAGNMKVSDMAKAGFLMNIIGILVLNIMTNTYGTLVFDFNHFPTLIADDSTTTSSTTTLGTILSVANSTDSPTAMIITVVDIAVDSPRHVAAGHKIRSRTQTSWPILWVKCRDYRSRKLVIFRELLLLSKYTSY
ncbi:unnamed protein product [Notodromas monacha]|uniref:Solute carrier family 13 member 5 n=1 Tax=Notodromas monacha TaxID=399045 RepID=A0A7R9BNQ1_9CRUS|nr:unnamed protein product [Notodromas monacha]CAG0918015.1 unnamed protein product [Notodromas monacha]